MAPKTNRVNTENPNNHIPSFEHCSWIEPLKILCRQIWPSKRTKRPQRADKICKN